MRPRSSVPALASAAALSFTLAAGAKAPHPRTAASADAPAASSTPPADPKGPADAEAPAGAPSATSAPDVPATPPSDTANPVAPQPSGTSSEPGPTAPSGGAAPSNPAESPHKSSTASFPAQPAAPKEPAKAEPEDDEQAVPPARDTVGGHFNVGLDAALVLPFGNVYDSIPQSRTMGPGLSLGGDVAYGVSRTVMLGAYVDVGLPSAEGAASKSNVTTIAAGPFVRYHLVQGLSFDPWVSGGLGFRRTSVGSSSYTGVDWFRFALGGDWYPAKNFGFGPFLELSAGTFFSQSPGTIGTKALDAHFVIGGRIVFDGPGR